MAAHLAHALLVAVLCLACAQEGSAFRMPASFSDLVYTLGAAAGQLADSISGRLHPQQVPGGDDTAIPPHPHHKDFDDGDDITVKRHWALIVAGSAGWGNYRHQADACHAYQVLRRGGLQPQNMVLMVYDDIAGHMDNPFPGKIFNKPGGPDVYQGVHIDYRGDDVNSQNFLAVLEGNISAVAGVGTGRVIASGPSDRVFVFYSDHGAPGVLGMPSGSFLYADELMAVLQRKHAKRGYKEAVLYVEACESGSMFEGLLSNDLNIYATTASNAFESSWGTYCPGMEPSPAPVFTTCLGDLYSVAWMENAESADLTHETIKAQFQLVQNRTSNNYTYAMGSHVMQYGYLGIAGEVAGDYEGMYNTGPEADKPRLLQPSSEQLLQGYQQLQRLQQTADMDEAASQRLRRQMQEMAVQLEQAGLLRVGPFGRWMQLQEVMFHNMQQQPQRDADLLPLRHKAVRGQLPEDREKAQAALDAELSRRATLDSAVQAAAAKLLQLPSTSRILMTRTARALGRTLSATADPSILLQPAAAFAQLMTKDPMGRPAPGLPLVDDWDCLRGMVMVWTDRCGRLGDYGMKHTRFFANMCNAGLAPAHLAEVLGHVSCAGEHADAAVAVF